LQHLETKAQRSRGSEIYPLIMNDEFNDLPVDLGSEHIEASRAVLLHTVECSIYLGTLVFGVALTITRLLSGTPLTSAATTAFAIVFAVLLVVSAIVAWVTGIDPFEIPASILELGVGLFGVVIARSQQKRKDYDLLGRLHL
jgi:phosphate/sulfate permease